MVSISNHGIPEDGIDSSIEIILGGRKWEEEANQIGLSIEIRYSTRTSIT